MIQKYVAVFNRHEVAIIKGNIYIYIYIYEMYYYYLAILMALQKCEDSLS